jgi:cytochrome c1
MQQHSVRYGLRAFLVIGLVLGGLVLLAACAGGGATPTATTAKPGTTPTKSAASPAASPAAKTVPGGNSSAGQQAIGKYGCGGCHTIPGVQGANGTNAPNLGGFAGRAQIAGAAPNTPENLVKWLQDPQSVKPDARMPKLGVTEQDAKDIGAYLYTLR